VTKNSTTAEKAERYCKLRLLRIEHIRQCQCRQLLPELLQRLPYAAQNDRPLPNEFGSGKTVKSKIYEDLYSASSRSACNALPLPVSQR